MTDRLVDTQSLIWFLEDDPRLPGRIKKLMEAETSRLFVSIASLWEMAIKMSLEFIHRDPFDRLIIAQALTENMPLISSDDVFARYPVQREWA